ncbi:hypothetical protein F2Q69_00026808 [Brassica cretica]|uniref:Uncharacterized protein n=1 Tax=Brassica cretica TaxID=69181 RepID=A0A8S9S8T4_BRACR|nr:hypothetical protein F2Q69_00026808 [Brassica cretica]
MATLLRLDTSTTFLAFTSPRAGTALNHRFASATRSRATVSVRRKTSPFYPSSSTVYSDNRRKPFSASATSLAVVETEDPFDVPTELTPDNRIPATIITGFLGSGKVRGFFVFRFSKSKGASTSVIGFHGSFVSEQTTLLNHILTGDHGKRIAVIENEVLC